MFSIYSFLDFSRKTSVKESMILKWKCYWQILKLHSIGMRIVLKGGGGGLSWMSCQNVVWTESVLLGGKVECNIKCNVEFLFNPPPPNQNLNVWGVKM